MNANGIVNVASAIVTLAVIATVVSSPQSAQVIRAVGDAFGGALRAAKGTR